MDFSLLLFYIWFFIYVHKCNKCVVYIFFLPFHILFHDYRNFIKISRENEIEAIFCSLMDIGIQMDNSLGLSLFYKIVISHNFLFFQLFSVSFQAFEPLLTMSILWTLLHYTGLSTFVWSNALNCLQNIYGNIMFLVFLFVFILFYMFLFLSLVLSEIYLLYL